MDISRRQFLKLSGAAGAGLLLGVFDFDLTPIEAYAQDLPPVWEIPNPSICPYCGCGCGVILGSDSSYNLIYVEGDPDNPINEGALCSKGQASVQLCTVDGAPNPQRLTQPLKRDPSVDKYNWIPISWSQAMSEIAGLIKAERDANLVVEEDGVTVNRLETIAALGTAKDTNEECYLFTKLMRALGIVYLEHCARV